jgi:hypothetical protein
MLNKLHSWVKQLSTKQLRVIVVVVVVAAIGTYLLVASHAASPYISLNADTGTLANGATKQACTGASDGSCVVFGSTTSSTQTDCFAAPGKCGYPDPVAADDPGGVANVGAGDCSKLPAFNASNYSSSQLYVGNGYIEPKVSDVTISNVNLGNLTIYIPSVSNNFTLDHVCMNVNGGGSVGSQIINASGGSSGLTIKNSTIGGANNTNEAVGKILNDFGANSTITNNYFYNFAGGVFEKTGGTSVVSNNYMLLNVTMFDSSGNEAHYEPMYCTDNPSLTIDHNTLLNVHRQTAEIFCNTNDGAGGTCTNHVSITNNLMAGGGAVIYTCAHATSAGTSHFDIDNNRFARCLGTPITHQYPNGGGGYTCGTVDNAGADSHGYWPYGGYYGIAWPEGYYPSNVTWSVNYWDDSPTQTICADGSNDCP